MNQAEEMVTVTMTIPKDKAAKLSYFMAQDTYEKAEAARNARLEKCRESLLECVRFVRQHHANSTRFIASVLCSLYNGDRVKVDLSGIGLVDPVWAEHVINVIRLHYEGGLREPHTYIQDGGRIFEEIIAEYRLEKKRRARP
jgi:hypothetical protein